MTRFTSTNDILDAMRQDPGVAAEMDARLAAIVAEQERSRQRAMFEIFAGVSRAAALPESERQAAIDELAALILDDPGLAHDLAAAWEDAIDEPYRLLRDALLDAADPVTGALPDDLALEPGMAELYAAGPSWQPYVTATLADVREDATNRMRAMAEGMQPVIDAYYQEIRRFPKDLHDGEGAPAASDALTQVAYALNLRGETADLPLTVGDQFEAYADDPDGYFRLGVTRVYQGDDRFAVTLRLYAAGSYDLLAAGRDEWRVYATRGDDALAVEADDLDDAAWRLAGSFTLGDLAGISFAAELIPPE